MNERKHIITIIIFAIVGVVILAVAVGAGHVYMNNTVETYEETMTAVEKVAETSVASDTETADILEKTDETEIIVLEETVEADSYENREIIEEEMNNIKEKLISLLENDAPLKWAKSDVNPNEFVKVYPELSFAYYDIDSGESITYESERVRYSASLIKALYIYSVLSEIEGFENSATRDENGDIVYDSITKKYDLNEKWIYNSAIMLAEGSGEIMNEQDGFELKWSELIDYALLYSDNVAFAQLRERFGYTYFYKQMADIGVHGIESGFMNLSVDDCVLFLRKLDDYFLSGSAYANHMKDCMTRSKHLEMICANYDEGMAAHKYGWDIGAFHDMAIVFDEHPYIIVIMTDYEDGGEEPIQFIADVTSFVKEYHALKYSLIK